MYSDKSILFTGNSHITCIRTALRNDPVKNVEAFLFPREWKDLSLKEKRDDLMAQISNTEPDYICLCAQGNAHNILGLFENPVPFSILDKECDTVPEETADRHFIPYGMMTNVFERKAPISDIKLLYRIFPNAKKLYINPPPPLADWDKLYHDSPAFRDRIHLGPAPEVLRLQLYKIQTEVTQRIAEDEGAEFIMPPAHAFNEDGFLAPKYSQKDPTHANAAYGKAIIEHVAEMIGDSK